MRTIVRWAATAAAVALVGMFLLRAGGEDALTLGPVDGHDLPAIDLERVVVGSEAPDFSLEALSGDVITLSHYRGKKNVMLASSASSVRNGRNAPGGLLLIRLKMMPPMLVADSGTKPHLGSP